MAKAALRLLASVLLGTPASSATPAPASVRVYVGTYTSGESRGIYRLRLDLATGTLTPEGEPAPAVDPSFLALSADGTRLYAVNETGQSRDDAPGAVSAFAVDAATGALTLLNKVSSGGAAPCHLSLDREGRHVLVANYWGGSVAVFALESDGRLGRQTAFVQHEGENPTPRDPGPHAHAIHVDPAGRHSLVTDLGLDTLFVYGFDPGRGALAPEPAPVALGPGAGPRHLAFHPDGRFVYVINELSSTITAFAYAAGAARELQTVSTLPAGFGGKNSTAEVAVSPDGRFLYGSNRGHDSLAIFAIDAASGKLTPVGHQPTRGRHPRHFALDPTGAYLIAANRDSDNLAVFRVDRRTGRLEPVGEPLRLPRPVCVRVRLVGD
ncbi:MAG TPA: lactonase family protein [Vicinamibacteria bacterium]|nr:lactonase family protein [Vicinamibacteria bacterium]